MGANPNTQTLKQVWDDIYQITHYKQPVYRAIVDERLASMLKKGDTVNRSYKSEFYVNDMGADGSYSTQAQADTNETLTINKTKEVSFYEFQKDLEQAHLDVKVSYARKAMNNLFIQIDSDVLAAAYAGATSTLDAGDLGGTAGTGITAGVANVDNIWSGALLKLQLQNIVYNANVSLSGDVKLENVDGMPTSVISPQLYQQLIIRVGGKTTVLGDKIAVSGHIGMYMGFQVFVSNNLTWTGQITVATTPTTGDSITINGLVFKYVTNATNPGEMTISGTTQALLVASLAAPFTAASGYIAQTDSAANRKKLANISASTFSSNTSTITQAGIGNAIVSSSFVSANNFWTTGKQIQHNLFCINKCVSLILQKRPELFVNFASGKVGKDYVTWTYYGLKVFTDQAPMIVDVQLDASGFLTQPATLAK